MEDEFIADFILLILTPKRFSQCKCEVFLRKNVKYEATKLELFFGRYESVI